MEGTNTGQLREVDVPTLLSTIAQQLDQNQGHLNNVDGAGTHGQRMAVAFNAAAAAARKSGSDDAGTQLEAAAQALRAQGKGKAAAFYADGLQQAARDFSGQQNISSANLLPFLQSFLGGVESNNPARPGQGTMIDAIQPAVSALNQAQQSGQPLEGGLLQMLGAAINGTQGTASNQGSVDPGAASATNVIGGIVAALAPTLLNMLMSNLGKGASGGAAPSYSTPQGGLGGYSQGNYPQSGGTDLGGLLGGLMGGQGVQTSLDAEPQGSSASPAQGGGVDLGGLLGGLMGGQGGQQQSSGGSTDWLGGLLGGLMGGSGQSGR